MEFLADECCDQGLVEKLRQSGHDVFYVFESNRGAADDDVLLWRMMDAESFSRRTKISLNSFTGLRSLPMESF